MTTTTKSKFAAKSSTVAAKDAPAKVLRAKRVQPTVHVEVPSTEAEAVQRANDFTNSTDFPGGWEAPSSTRVLCATVTAFFTGYTVSYSLATVAMLLSDIAFFYTASGFLSLLVALVGLFITVVVAIRAGVAAGKFVLGFSFSEAKESACVVRDAAKHKVSVVRGWFKRSPAIEVQTASPVAA